MAVDLITKRHPKMKYLTSYTFPRAASEISNNNNYYTAPTDGIIYMRFVFDNSTYSQCNVYFNDTLFTVINSGDSNVNGVSELVPFPVSKGDTIHIDFYSTFTMKSIMAIVFKFDY